MAEVVTPPPSAGFLRALWPVDWLFLAYLAVIAVLISADISRVPDASALLAAHAAGVALILAAAWSRSLPALTRVFRHWYPLAFIPLSYKEMAVLIPPIRHTDFDAQLASLDYRIWGAHPTVWLERLMNPWVTEILQIAYTLFIPSVIVVAAAIWVRKLYPQFRYYAFLVGLGFLASYVGYLFVPVRGPRFFLAHLQHVELHGVWLFDPLQRVLDRLESAHYDCFPSGHTEMTIVAWWGSRFVSRRLFAGFSLYVILIVSATVYLRYHYTVDVFAGVALAVAVLVGSPRLYAILGSRRSSPSPTTAAEVFH